MIYPGKSSKYHNRKTLYQGIRFDSQKEFRRYQELLLMEQAGAIRHLELQPQYDFVINGKKLKHYYQADFRYEEVSTGQMVTEDVKGFRTKEYSLKKELVEALYGIEIIEIEG
jgi:hypothetical protein